ncbi:hypothetical protein BDY19DRAFT_994383 [Irpex rosettiformis]|uniref:Uncharacterized protein n=1 Tax=Irpex rosettiformis TaxID=378272 RepID=A0ACB8U0V5_9APHY|nr:hypothetical protein BDY19DRAFT_994383 [Irpex rosettiformis]
MAPARSSGRRARTRRKAQNAPPQLPVVAEDEDELAPQYEQLFLDPMSGQPLQLYIDKDVEGKDAIAQQIVRHGGVVSPGYSGVLYILVDPHKESGQNLYRQYAGKKNKIVVHASWVHHCINDKTLHGFSTNWAGCKVTGKEQSYTALNPAPGPSSFPVAPTTGTQQPGTFLPAPTQPVFHGTSSLSPAVHAPQMQPPPTIHHLHPPIQPSNVQSTPIPAGVQSSAVAPAQTLRGHPISHDSLAPSHSQHQTQSVPPTAHQGPFTYPPPPMHPDASAPPQTWQANSGIAPQQTHIAPPPPYRHPQDYREWSYQPPPQAQPQPPPPATSTQQHNAQPPPTIDYQSHPGYDYGYRDREQGWVDGAAEYYSQQYGQPGQYTTYPPPPPPPSAEAPEPQPLPEAGPPEDHQQNELPRGRRRSRQQQPGAPPATTLVANRKNPVTRSPTPPTRVIKSTYGGNLFTVDDVMYLKKYIDYCQEQGLVLSLREICERIAIKAPHHTFYSWRRYCNKHQIRLGGYAMEIDHDELGEGPSNGHPIEEEPGAVDAHGQLPPQPPPPTAGVVPGSIAAARRAAVADAQRTRSPTPPRALYRSTTGKGVAFTEEDVTFLVRFLEYRSRMGNGKVDMVAFWKDVAAKAPHHSRASWMKFYRRHKHELYHEDGDDPLPQPPEKKMRYSKGDDILLAKHFASRREGTSDKIFQEFARLYSHHPWKGWQEHHRIHKAKIDHLISKLNQGQSIDEEEGE